MTIGDWDKDALQQKLTDTYHAIADVKDAQIMHMYINQGDPTVRDADHIRVACYNANSMLSTLMEALDMVVPRRNDVDPKAAAIVEYRELSDSEEAAEEATWD